MGTDIETVRRSLRDAAFKLAEARVAALMALGTDDLKAFEAEIDRAKVAIGAAQAITRREG